MEVVILAIAMWGVISGASQAAVDHAYARRGGEHPRYDLARQRIAARQARAARRERIRASRGTWREPKTPAAKFARSLFDDAMETAHYKHTVKHGQRMEKRKAIDSGERDRGALSGVLVKLRGKFGERWDVAWGKVGERIDRRGGQVDKPGPDKDQRRADKDEQRRYRDEVRERYAPKPTGQADNQAPDTGQADSPRRRLDGARPDREGWADTGQGTRGYPYWDGDKYAWVADGTVISEDPDWFLSVEADPRVRHWIEHRTNGVTDPLEAWQMLNHSGGPSKNVYEIFAEWDETHRELWRLIQERWAAEDAGAAPATDRAEADRKVSEPTGQQDPPAPASVGEARNIYDHEFLSAHGRLPRSEEIPAEVSRDGITYDEVRDLAQAAKPEVPEADRKFHALRDSGYTGPIDQDGNRVVSMDAWVRDNHPLGVGVPTASRDTTDAEAQPATSETETPIGRAITNMTTTMVPAGEAVTLEGAKGFVDGMLQSTKAGVSACDQGGSDLMTTIKGLKDLCQAAMSACEQAGADMEGSEVGAGITGPIGAGQAKFADALAKVEALEQQANNVFAEVGEALGEAAAELTKAQSELTNAEGVRDAYDAAPDAGHKQWVQG